jgi:putative lipoprotein
MAEAPGAERTTLTGTVSYRERMALPVNATIDVRLLDVSLQDVPARILAQQTIEAAGQSVPIPFTLEYDPSQVQERLSYAVRAEIRSADGKLLWTTDTVHPVLTRDAPGDGVEIRLVRVGG